MIKLIFQPIILTKDLLNRPVSNVINWLIVLNDTYLETPLECPFLKLIKFNLTKSL